MKWIAHRSNFTGAFPEFENDPSHIDKALLMGYDVEIDIWKCEENWMLGHDFPQYEVGFDWLADRSNYLLCHLKNKEAFVLPDFFNKFWHDSDDYVFTSKGWVIVHSGLDIIEGSVCMMPEHHPNFGREGCPLRSGIVPYAICTDNIEECKRIRDDIKQD
jgi:hypothetical protein